jgi:hypothetical protein
LKTTVVYLVRSFRTNARIRSLTTGTFNRVVKDRIAIRLSGANSGLDGPATRANPAVLETLQTYVAAQHPVNADDSQNFHVISTTGNSGADGRAGPQGLKPKKSVAASAVRLKVAPFPVRAHYGAQRYGLPRCIKTAPDAPAHGFLGHSKAEDRKLRKDPTLGGSLL